MKKFFIFNTIAGILLSPSISLAAYNDVTLTTSAVIQVGSYTLDIYGSSAVLQSIVVSSTTLQVTLASGSSASIVSPSLNQLSSDVTSDVTENTCSGSNSVLSLAYTGAGTVTNTITPGATICSGSGSTPAPTPVVSSGGGGGGFTPPSVTTAVLSKILAPSASATAYLNSLATNQSAAQTTVGAGVSLPTINLTLGSQGTDVVSLQNFLISQGDLDSQYNTGFFGPLTKSALAKYQADHRITPAIGFYGPLTRAVIASNGVSATTVTTTTAAPATTTSSSTSTTTFTRNLQLGDTGSDVEALQHFLNTHSFSVASTGPGSLGNETTYFGPATQSALVKFQKANNITPAVGYFGPITRQAISQL